MKVKKNILSLLMIVMLVISVALPVSADTVISTNDGTVLVCDDNGNCQIVGYINSSTVNNGSSNNSTSNNDAECMGLLKVLGVGIIFLVMGLIMTNIVEHTFDCNPAAKQFAYAILILGLAIALTSFVIMFSEGFSTIVMNLIFG